MASCVRNICSKNYQNLIIGFKVTVKNETQCIFVYCTQLTNRNSTYRERE